MGGSIIVYIVSAACGSGSSSGLLPGGDANVVPDAKANTNGSRLKSKFYALEDGSRQTLPSWRDTQRNEDCTVRLAADVQLRCLPAAQAIEMYKDDKCTIPLLVERAGCPEYLETTSATIGACLEGAPAKLFKKGASAGVAPSDLVYRVQTTCTSIGAAAGRGNLFLVDEVPPTSFVAATVSIEGT